MKARYVILRKSPNFKSLTDLSNQLIIHYGRQVTIPLRLEGTSMMRSALTGITRMPICSKTGL